MKLISQFNDHACFPACLESFLHDQDCPIDQRQIVADFPSYHAVGQSKEGSFEFSLPRLKELGKKYRFDVQIIEGISHPVTLSAKETILIAALEFGPGKTRHCMRFVEFLPSTGQIATMNPERGAAFPFLVSIKDADNWKCILLKLRFLGVEKQSSDLPR